MTRLEFSVEIAAPRQAVWDFYDNLDNLPRITPPSTRVEVRNAPPAMTEGTRFLLVLRQPPLYVPIRWETIIAVHRPPVFFIDEQGKSGPFAFWRHEHLLEDLGDGRTLLRDSIMYRAPLGALGSIADYAFLRPMLTSMFAYRHLRTREALEGVAPQPAN